MVSPALVANSSFIVRPIVLLLVWLFCYSTSDATEPKAPAAPVVSAEASEHLAAHFGFGFDFDTAAESTKRGTATESLPDDQSLLAAGAKIEAVGPTSPAFEGMPKKNSALVLNGKGARFCVADNQDDGPLDFDLGDAITLEAWVRPDRLSGGANVYIVGKGRTYETQQIENQNYALRLNGVKGEARVSFLFATEAAKGGSPKYHRWTSDRGFVPDGGWHHVAVSYRFGTPESIVGIVDGEKVKGKWDMAGSTEARPTVDNDALWIGSSRGGEAGNSFAGAIDDVMIHRELVAPSILLSRRRVLVNSPEFPALADPSRVTITLHPGLSSHTAWPAAAPAAALSFTSSHLAYHRLPLRYISGGLRQPWPGPLLLRAYSRTRLPHGELTFLLRSPGLARLWIDGKVIISTPAHILFPDAHQPFEVYQADDPWLRVPRAGDWEKRATLTLSAGAHDVILEQIVGAKGIRSETGDTTVAVRRGDELFTLVGPTPFETPLSDSGWSDYQQRLESELVQLDARVRRETTSEEQSFWDRRHQLALETLAKKPIVEVPQSATEVAEHNAIDRFLAAQIQPAHDRLTTDAVFLRRLYLDTVGVLPSAAEVQAFQEDQAKGKRAALIDRLLADERWADHWTSYWQDVLAENPSILKPTLNNTGPFRWWIYDALIENKPMDRFVTELIRMEGDVNGGGAAGFAMASENDVPMAAKAHILASAFLAVDMKCARCHDAPYHPWTQKELFGLAAMLENKPIKVPATSSVPKEFFDRKQGDTPVVVSIVPGEEIAPAWPFDSLNATEPTDDMLGRDNESRERLAAAITSAENDRFAEVMVNRLWQRVMGWGLVGLVGDWHDQNPRHPELLKFLGREFVKEGYDFKQAARLIFNSRAYQRVAVDGDNSPAALAYTSPWIRRMSAEQVVDSLHAVAGYPLGTEEITFDPSAQQHDNAFLNLGFARRAWQLTSLSNERDRPSLALPKAAIVVECLEAFGWRGSRQEPVSHRETDANMVQPGVIANSAMSVRLSRLSDEAAFTQFALDASSPEEFIQLAFQQVLTRQPSAAELKTFVQQVAPGFERRIKTLALPAAEPTVHRGFVTWANHFDIRSNQLVRDIEREVAAGPPPTERLDNEWRQRAEDAVWALMNSPEFQFVP